MPEEATTLERIGFDGLLARSRDAVSPSVRRSRPPAYNAAAAELLWTRVDDALKTFSAVREA
jgi:dienelactone hydrolase